MSAARPLALSFERGLFCGVCGGMAERLGWKPTVVRVMWALMTLASGLAPGLLAYLFLYLVMPGPQLAHVPRHNGRA
jgi:phage shock protein C